LGYNCCARYNSFKIKKNRKSIDDEGGGIFVPNEIRIRNCKYLSLQQVVDESDGILSIAEAKRNIPFDIKRIFYIYGLSSPKAQRGFHAHKELEQVLICLSGSCKLMLADGDDKQYFFLKDPNQGIYIAPKVWLQLFEFSSDCILLIFASDYFEEADYIRDFEEFIKYVESGTSK
jgi:hypothetical protein